MPKGPVVRLDPQTPDLQAVLENLSAMALVGEDLWLGGDEGTCLERVTRDGPDFAKHRRFDLAEILDLPATSEIDIEGMDHDGGHLWVIGSHSLRRKKPSRGDSDRKVRECLGRVDFQPNRHTLARLALEDGKPISGSMLEGDREGNLLTKALAGDPLLGVFSEIPSKDNGIDIEALAVREDRVFAGLRGPVLRGWAVVLEFRVKETRPPALALNGGVKKHLLKMQGLGVRDLTLRGSDLYLLAGPTMDLDGPSAIYRWKNALKAKEEAVVWDPEEVSQIPYGKDSDHAEALCWLDKDRLLVCYDSPGKGRLVGESGVRLDVFDV